MKNTEFYNKLIGKKVKKLSNKAFKSTLRTNTVKGIINHPQLNIPAFTFEEDESYVECHRCIPKDSIVSFHRVLDLYPGYSIVGVESMYIPERGWITTYPSKNSKPLNHYWYKVKPEIQVLFCLAEGAEVVMLTMDKDGDIANPDYKISELVTL